jgi:hypothetical protein
MGDSLALSFEHDVTLKLADGAEDVENQLAKNVCESKKKLEKSNHRNKPER